MKTPQILVKNLASALGLKNDLYLKREDLHRLGSHKGRSLPHMIRDYRKHEIKKFVISSSGNAALAAAMFISDHNHNNPDDQLELKIFVGEHIIDDKFEAITKLTSEKILIEKVNNPKQSAHQMDADGAAKNLRQSTDDLALNGYTDLAKELSKIPNLRAVFIPTSSGTTAEALGKTFKKLGVEVEIHIVQTVACHPIIDAITDQPPTPPDNTQTSLAGAIVDNIAHRKDRVVEIVKTSGGDGYIATDEEIVAAIKLVKETEEIDISPNSALSVVGLNQAIKNGWNIDGAVVCLITGR